MNADKNSMRLLNKMQLDQIKRRHRKDVQQKRDKSSSFIWNILSVWCSGSGEAQKTDTPSALHLFFHFCAQRRISIFAVHNRR